MKTIGQQIHVMRRLWPGFTVVEQGPDFAVWIGSLVGIERTYRIMIEYGLPRDPATDPLCRFFPTVRVLSPPLQPNFDAAENAPLPHVFFDRHDLTLSILCLFDPQKDEWSYDDFIARTTIYWACDWLACYEGWLVTGRWHGGGRHPQPSGQSQEAVA